MATPSSAKTAKDAWLQRILSRSLDSSSLDSDSEAKSASQDASSLPSPSLSALLDEQPSHMHRLEPATTATTDDATGVTTAAAAAAAAPACVHCISLQEQLRVLQQENDALQEQLEQLQLQRDDGDDDGTVTDDNATCSDGSNEVRSPTGSSDTDDYDEDEKPRAEPVGTYSPMTRSELQRYGRQMLVKEFGGIKSQLKLRDARVLVVGVGGLGSPVALYLAAMGVGHLGLVDDDRVERSNLHRQVIHDESTLLELKVASASQRIAKLNPEVHCELYPIRLGGTNALELVEQYDVVVDASDNVATRYLVNDACAMTRTPLVSGSALGLEGQVTVFAFDSKSEATAAGCYRCLYPKPQPTAAAMSCSENGVLGVVPGIIGCLQAMETIKVLTGFGEPLIGVQCFYDAYDGQFRRLKIGTKRRSDCAACSPSALSQRAVQIEQLVCASGAIAVPVSLEPENHISAQEFGAFRSRHASSSYVLIDTRVRSQFDMVHFPEAVHLPFESFMKQQHGELSQSLLGQLLLRPTVEEELQQQDTKSTPARERNQHRTFVICRRGVDSMVVTQWLVSQGVMNVQNVDGGYAEYARSVDRSFPMY